MKRFLSVFLPTILAISCFFYVFPLTSFAETWFDNYTAWDIVSGYDNPSTHVYASSSYVTKHYAYSQSTYWAELEYTVASTYQAQLPSPFYNLRNLLYQPGFRRASSSIGEEGLSNLSFSFWGDFQSYISALNLQDDDFLCFAQMFQIGNELLDIHYTFGNIVTGNAFEPFASIDDRFLVYNNGVPNMTTSGIIDTSLWSTPSSGTAFVLAYFNILGSDLLNYSDLSSLNSIVISLDFPSGSNPLNVSSFKPILYKTSLDGEIQTVEYLSSINDNVQIVANAVQSHVDPSINQPDYSSINAYEQQLGDDTALISSSFDQWLLNGSELAIGLAWVGSVLTLFVNRFPFLQGIYGLILFFAVANLLRGGIFRKEWDYVTEDNYTVIGHNSKGDYEITGTRTTRRE